MASNTDIDICNVALSLCSIDPISSFTDGTTESDQARLLYEPTVRALLIEYGWTFTGSYQQLTPTGNIEAAAPWLTAFELPASCLEIRSLKHNGFDVPYERAGQYVYTKLTENDLPVLEFTKRVTEDKFTPHFQTLLHYRLAGLFAASITRNESLANLWIAEFERLTGKMHHRDSAQQTTKQIRPSRFLTRR